MHSSFELLIMCLTKSCFPDCWKVSSVVPVFKNVGDMCMDKNCRPGSLLSAVSKVSEKLVNDRLVDHKEKYCLFCAFQYGFRFSLSTADFLKVIFDRIGRVFNGSGTTRTVKLDRSKVFDMVCHVGLLQKPKS